MNFLISGSSFLNIKMERAFALSDAS